MISLSHLIENHVCIISLTPLTGLGQILQVHVCAYLLNVMRVFMLLRKFFLFN